MPNTYWKTGADPEAVIWSKGQGKIIAATSLCGGRASMNSRIGTDGHAATLELRPSPSKSVMVVMADVAESLLAIKKFLDDVNRDNPSLGATVVAQAYCETPCGGHIHESFKVGAIVPSGTFETLAQCIHALVGPVIKLYEKIDPTVRQRNGSGYGETGSLWREQPGGKGWLRLEYRMPPTWLHSPLVAYCFLGTAKLAMLTSETMQQEGVSSLIPTVTKLIGSLASPGELKQLPEALKRLAESSRPIPAGEPLAVDFVKWAKFLNGGD